MRIKINGSLQQILIPYKAVTEQMGEYFVYVVNGNTVNQRKVLPGTRIGDKVIIKDGLQLNEKIATEGVQKLKDGAIIQVASEGQATHSSAPGK